LALDCVEEILRTGGKQGRSPELWDGLAAGRIAEELHNFLHAADTAREKVPA
jgi:hypothetical protein